MSTVRRIDALKHTTVGRDGIPESRNDAEGAQLDRFMVALLRLQTDDPARYVNLAGIHGGMWDDANLQAHAERDLKLRLKKDGRQWKNHVFCHHGLESFLLWHRAFLAEIERMLQVIDSAQPPLVIPFWNYDASATLSAFPVLFTAPKYRLTSSKESPKRVIANPFHPDQWFGLLQRTLAKYPDIASDVAKPREAESQNIGNPRSLNRVATTFSRFAPGVEDKPHNAVHNVVNGAMQFTQTAAFDPIFIVHHCNVDRHFTIWQRLHPQNDVKRAMRTPSALVAPFGTPQQIKDGKLALENSDVQSTCVDWWSAPAPYEGLEQVVNEFLGNRGMALRKALHILELTLDKATPPGAVTVALPKADGSSLTLTFHRLRTPPKCVNCEDTTLVNFVEFLPDDVDPTLLGDIHGRPGVVVALNGTPLATGVIKLTVTKEAEAFTAEHLGHARDALYPDATTEVPDDQVKADVRRPHCRGKDHSLHVQSVNGKLRLRVGKFGRLANAPAFDAALQAATTWWNTESGGLVAVEECDRFEDADVIATQEPLTALGNAVGWTSHPKDGRHHFVRIYVDVTVTTQAEIVNVLRHEIGHALGLGHSSDSTSLMFPFVSDGTGGVAAALRLTDAEKQHLQDIIDIEASCDGGDGAALHRYAAQAAAAADAAPSAAATTGELPSSLFGQGPSTAATGCPLCGQVFSNRGNAARHIHRFHGAPSSSVAVAEEFVKSSRAH